MDEIKSMNIPRISIREAVDQLAFAYGRVIQEGLPVSCLPSTMLWGPPGVGKSQGVRQLAAILQRETGKQVLVTDVRLLLFNPVDLRGIPTANADKTLAIWLKPKIFQMEEGVDAVNILFLDELSAAPPSVQAAAYQICLDRQVGEHNLPENCLVIAAGNRMTDGSVAYRMPKALSNRLMHFEIVADFWAWKKWAREQEIDSRIISFLSADNSRLIAQPDAGDLAFTTPRSWEFVDTLLKRVSADPGEIRPLISGCVGEDTAIAFEAWCHIYDELPPVEEILAGRCLRYPKRQETFYTMINSILAAVQMRGEAITDLELEHVCDYALRFPADFAAVFFEDLRAIEKIQLKLMDCRALKTWLGRG